MMAHEQQEILIRPYKVEDREAIRRINYETSFLHKPHLFFDDQDVVADALTRYYTDYEPGSCFVAESAGEVVGYIIGTLDIKRMHREYGFRIILPLLVKSVGRGVFFNRKTYSFLLSGLNSYLKGEFSAPNFIQQYPSTFHINVREGFRGQRVGSRLILRAVQLIHANHVTGVQFSTMSQEPKEFFINMGFHVIYESRRSFLRYAFGHDTPFFLFGMKI